MGDNWSVWHWLGIILKNKLVLKNNTFRKAITSAGQYQPVGLFGTIIGVLLLLLLAHLDLAWSYGASLGPCWPILVLCCPFGAYVRPLLAPMLDHLGPMLAHLGAILPHLGGLYWVVLGYILCHVYWYGPIIKKYPIIYVRTAGITDTTLVKPIFFEYHADKSQRQRPNNPNQR